MDTIIRSARLADDRAALGHSRPAAAPQPRADVVQAPSPEQLREAIEASVRKEIAAEAAKTFEAERRRGHELGLEQGRREGAERAREQATAFAQAQAVEIRETLKRIDAAIGQHRAALEGEIGPLVLMCLTRMLGESVAHPAAIESMVRQVLTTAHAAGRVRVRLHPADIATLEQQCDPQELAAAAQEVELVPDNSLLAGGCIAETPIGQFDASIDTQLRILHSCLVTERRQRVESASEGP